ncbi:MAG TPA: hypothetical protein VEY50_11715 [Lysobacter sp.]|nr:hypothetical protein [Lysobacter sp.]
MGGHPPTEPGLWRARLIAGAIVLALLLGLALTFGEPMMRSLWPRSQAEELEARAARALAAGELTRPDGRGARELYLAALAIDPDRPQARAGLQDVGDAALQAGYDAADAGRMLQAREMLELARALQVPVAQSEALAEHIRLREAATADIDRLLVAATAARGAGHYEQAVEHYARVLELAPAHTEALEGREDVLAEMLQRARQAIDAGKLHVATTLVASVRLYDGGHVDLPDTLAALSAAGERQRQRGDRALGAGRLDEATAAFLAASAVDGERAAAMQGLERVALAYARRSRREASEFRFDQARAALAAAEAIAPELPPVREARDHLARAERTRRREPAAGAPAATAATDAARAATARLAQATTGSDSEVLRLLEQANAAQRRGDLLVPPGASAYDKLRAASALAPQDPRVRAAMAQLQPAARSCFERELARNRLLRARHCLDAMQAFAPDGIDTRLARSRLARRWVAVGDERLGAGEIGAARDALAAARALDPAAPGAEALAERLRQISIGP